MKTGIGQLKYCNLTLFHVRCLISPCKSLLDCNVFNFIYFDWSRSFWIRRWARLIVHGFCSGYFTLTKHYTQILVEYSLGLSSKYIKKTGKGPKLTKYVYTGAPGVSYSLYQRLRQISRQAQIASKRHLNTKRRRNLKTSALYGKQTRNPCSGPQLCTRIGVRPMIGLLKMILWPVCQSNWKKIDTLGSRGSLADIRDGPL